MVPSRGFAEVGFLPPRLHDESRIACSTQHELIHMPTAARLFQIVN